MIAGLGRLGNGEIHETGFAVEVVKKRYFYRHLE